MMVINEENYRMWIGLGVFMIIVIFCWSSCVKPYSNTPYYSNTYHQERDEDSVFRKIKNKIEYKKLEIKNKVKRFMYKMRDNIDDVKDEIKYKKWELEEKLKKMVDD